MRKYILLGLLIGIMPNLCLGASIRYSQLIKEKQRKIEELEKCTGSTGKLKIAGISTLGLTAVGVAGNVVEAKKIKEYGKESEKLDKKLETARKEKEAEEKRVKREEESKECMESAKFKGAKLIGSMEKDENGNCVIDDCVRNAKENENGTDCECDEGYEQSGKQCVKKGGIKQSDTPAEEGLKNQEAKDGKSYKVNGGEWFVEFDYGTVFGVWDCNSAMIGESYEKQSEIYDGNVGKYCWCTVDSFIPNGTDEEEQDGENLPWVGLKEIESSCESSCGEACAKGVKTNSSLRKALYTLK